MTARHYSNSQKLVISFEYSWFLAKKLSNFVSLPWKLHNQYCHTPRLQLNTPITIRILPKPVLKPTIQLTKIEPLLFLEERIFKFMTIVVLLLPNLELLENMTTIICIYHFAIITIINELSKILSKKSLINVVNLWNTN